MSKSTERNIVIGAAVFVLLFLLLRKVSATAPTSFAPPLPDEDKLTPTLFPPDSYSVETLQPPDLPYLQFVRKPLQAPMITIGPPDHCYCEVSEIEKNQPKYIQ